MSKRKARERHGQEKKGPLRRPMNYFGPIVSKPNGAVEVFFVEPEASGDSDPIDQARAFS